MNIIYVSTLCSKRKFTQLFNMCKVKPVQQGQKYTSLLISGFIENGVDITIVSAYPISRKNTNKLFFKKDKEHYNRINYIYLSFINIFLIKHLILFLQTMVELIKLFKEDKHSIVIVDALNTSISFATIIISKIFKKKIISTITDIPYYMHKMESKKFSVKIFLNYIIENIFKLIVINSNGFIFVTEYINIILNNKYKKNVTIEGIVDNNMVNIDNTLSGKYNKKICIYAGALNSIYGVKMLADAFLEANIQDSEMHFYGIGDCSDYLEELAIKNCNIKYFGMIHNDLVIQEQLKATLLINPRPTNEEYTKYSFPSKNMEYMVSGTPVFTTNLVGMPEEYKKYVYLIENETVEGLAEELKWVLSKPVEELHEKGQKAKEFVLREKNNVIQAKKIINMVKEIV